MKKSILLILLIISGTVLFAQDSVPVIDKPVRAPFESGYLIDNQTSLIAPEGTLEFVIQHKFGTFQNGKKDVWGVYAPGANVRLGLDYVIMKNVQLGYGLTKSTFTHDVNLKWTIFEQTRNNTKPVALCFYGNMGIDARPKEDLMKNYSFIGRFSYFGQIIIGRKFNDIFTLQTGLSMSHYNMVDTAMTQFDKLGFHFNGRIQYAQGYSILFNYDQPLKINGMVQNDKLKKQYEPRITIGYEISTSTHAFQIYAGHSSAILPQDMMVGVPREMKTKQFGFGFTITRLWSL